MYYNPKRRHAHAVEVAAEMPETGICGSAPSIEGFPLPEAVIIGDVFGRLELESLCTLACVCSGLRSLVSQALSTLTTLDLSEFSPNGEILCGIIRQLSGVKSLTIDCLRLDDSSIISILGAHIEELNLLKGASISYHVLDSIGEKCPNLRILVLDLAGVCFPYVIKMLRRLLHLEHFSIKMRTTEDVSYYLECVDLLLPKTLKSLKLQPVHEYDATQFIERLGNEPEIPKNLASSRLTHLSLVLDVISDRVIISITRSLPLLVEINLEDRPLKEPKLPHDLTNKGLQFLGSCQRLIRLSIVRSRQNFPASFRRVNDLGIMLLSESCVGLESVTLGGFSVVSDAGYASLLCLCHNLKKFEIHNAPLLSDLAFHDINGASSPLVELKLQSCKLITSEAVAELTSSRKLEVLDTYSCRSIADTCIYYISCLSTLTSLNLGKADITDDGLIVLSKGNLPIKHLCLRGCTRVTERGIISLFNNSARIKKTLMSLDISYMPGVSDRALVEIILNAESITELCMRNCPHATDVFFRALAHRKHHHNIPLQKLDICNCMGFSSGAVEVLEKSLLLRGMRWLGIGRSFLQFADFSVICGARPWLAVCLEGCEVGCHDSWQFHKYSVSVEDGGGLYRAS